MAKVKSVAKAQVYGLALKEIFGQSPSYNYEGDHVRIYYQPDRLVKVQQRIKDMSSRSPSDVRIDWLPIVQPQMIKKALPFAVGIFAVGYIIGKL